MNRPILVLVISMLLAGLALADGILPFTAIGPTDPLVNGLCDDFRDGHHLFVTTEEGFYAWDDDLQTWNDYTQPGWIGVARTAVVLVPDLPDRRVLGGVNAFFKGTLWLSDDQGANQDLTWESTGGRVTDLAVSHGYQTHLILATTWSDVAPGELLRSVDDGESWVPLTNHSLFNLTGVEIIAHEEVYVSGDDQVLRSFDSGDTWENLTGNLPAGQGLSFVYVEEPVTALPQPAKDDPPSIHADRIYTSNDQGLYLTGAEEIDWEQVLPFPCRAMSSRFVQLDTFLYWYETWVVTQDGRLLLIVNGDWQEPFDGTAMLGGGVPVDVTASYHGVHALTQEHGVFRSSGYDYPTASPLPPASVSLAAAPNPFNPRTTVQFDLPQAGQVALDAFDLRGRRVARLTEGFHAAGHHELAWDAGPQLASGVYLLRLETGQGTVNQRVALVR